MKKGCILILLLAFCACTSEKNIRFAVCSDVHQDLIHNAPERLEHFISTAEKNNSDFIIQLGDFCMPKAENKSFVERWNAFPGVRYHVLGNHDMDISSKEETQAFWGMPKAYYSFDQGSFHFVVLDPNYYIEGDSAVSYNRGNYYAHAEGRAFIPADQLKWLEEDLAATTKRTIVFSHQSLEHPEGIKNRTQVQALFAKANHKSKKVIACFCGHDHEDRYAEIEGVHYIGLNSASYSWVGKKLEYSGRFSEEIETQYPNLKYTLPYAESVFAVVEIDPKGTITIKGVDGTFVSPGPKELGAEEQAYSAKISNRIIKF